MEEDFEQQINTNALKCTLKSESLNLSANKNQSSLAFYISSLHYVRAAVYWKLGDTLIIHDN